MEEDSLPKTPSHSAGFLDPICSSTPLAETCESTSTSPMLEASRIDVETSLEDTSERESVETFITSTCGCKIGPKSSPCSSVLSRDTIVKYRMESLELTRDELDLVVLAQIRACRSVASQPSSRRTNHEKSTDCRSRTKYYVHGLEVCRQTFMFLHCIGHKRLENLLKHFEQIGLNTCVHGNTKRLPVTTLFFEDTNRLVAFITNYARVHAMPLPGRLPGHKDKVMVLPSDITKVFVYSKYRQACDANNWTLVRRTKFYDVWQHLLPHISVSTPSTDLCFTCQQNNLSIQKSACLSEEEKAERLASAQEHILHAKTEREYYNCQVESAQTSCTSSEESGEPPRIAHYSYDFAQQIHYPYDAQQTGPEYFKTARKCGLFGVCNDGINKQVLYLVDEAENPGKGADCVISLIHHYIETYGHGEKCLYLHADNCVGQNKNNANIQYLMWRVLKEKEESIELSFMLVGHTKFSPDRHFGTFKKAFRVSSVSSLVEIVSVVERSTTNIPQVIRDVSGKVLVPFYEWSTYLSKIFCTIPNITSYHNFRISSSKPGIVSTYQFSDSLKGVEIDIMKPGILPTSLPTCMPEKTYIPGLDLKRQWYLYENIRMHCKSNLTADLTCPKPSAPKPSATKPSAPKPSVPSLSTSQSETTTSTPKRNTSNALEPDRLSGKRKRTCSVCKQPGHTKKSCPVNQ